MKNDLLGSVKLKSLPKNGPWRCKIKKHLQCSAFPKTWKEFPRNGLHVFMEKLLFRPLQVQSLPDRC